MTVAEFAKQRDKDECPVGKDIRLGNVAMNLAKDGHVGNTDFYRATAEGAESPAALVRTGIPENSESGTFNGKITIVNGSVALTGNQLGAPECIVIADSIQQVG